VVKSESICNLRKDLGISAVPDISRLAFLASFRIKFRKNNFVACFYILLFIFIFFFSNFISMFRALITAGKYLEDER